MVKIWKMGEFYKVYSENTKIIRQIGGADNCRVSSSYFKQGKLVAMDAIMPFKAKYGRRIVRILNNNRYAYRDRKPNLTADNVLEVLCPETVKVA